MTFPRISLKPRPNLLQVYHLSHYFCVLTENEVQLGVGLEGVVQGDKKRRLAHCLQHLTLCLGVLSGLLLLNYARLLQHFHGVEAPVINATLLTNQEYFAVCCNKRAQTQLSSTSTVKHYTDI